MRILLQAGADAYAHPSSSNRYTESPRSTLLPRISGLPNKYEARQRVNSPLRARMILRWAKGKVAPLISWYCKSEMRLYSPASLCRDRVDPFSDFEQCL